MIGPGEAANTDVASAQGIRQRFGGSMAHWQPLERLGGAHSRRLSRSVVSEIMDEFTAPSRGTRPSGPSRGTGAVAAAAGRTGQGGRGSSRCVAQASRSRSPAWAPVAGHWSAPGGWARCLRTASGSHCAGPCGCGASEGTL